MDRGVLREGGRVQGAGKDGRTSWVEYGGGVRRSCSFSIFNIGGKDRVMIDMRKNRLDRERATAVAMHGENPSAVLEVGPVSRKREKKRKQE